MSSNSWQAGWISGDVPTAAEFSKGVGAIYNTTLAVATATIDITGIVAVYGHLLLLLHARGDTAAASVPLWVRLNNDSASSYNYDSTGLAGTTLTSLSSSGAGTGVAAVMGNIPASTAVANSFGDMNLRFLHYADASNHKVITMDGAFVSAESAAGLSHVWGRGRWKATAAINRITVLPGTGNFVAGTRATLYAMGF